MILNKVGEFRKVRSELFYIGTTVVYQDDNAIVEIDESGNRRELFSEKENFFLEKADTIDLYIGNSKTFFRLKDGKMDKVFHWEPGQIKYVEADHFLLRSEQPGGDWKLSFINMDSGKVIWEVENDNTYTCTPYRSFFILLSHDHVISCHVAGDGRKLWELDAKMLFASGEGSMMESISGWGRRIFFYADEIKKGATFCVDINNGNVIRKIDFGTWIIPSGDYLYGVNVDTVRKLDPVSFEVEDIKIEGMGRDKDIAFSWNRFVKEGNELWFAARYGMVLGCVDLKERRVIGTVIIPASDEFDGISRIAVRQNRVYVLTQKGVLHIFQRG